MNTATVSQDGTAVMHLEGKEHRVSASTVEDARIEVIQIIQHNADDFPVRVVITDPDESRTTLEFDRDGSVSEVAAPEDEVGTDDATADERPAEAPQTPAKGSGRGSSAAPSERPAATAQPPEDDADDELPTFLGDVLESDDDDDLPMTGKGSQPSRSPRSRRGESKRRNEPEPEPVQDETEVAPRRAEQSQTKPTAADFQATRPAPDEKPAETGWRGALNMLGMRIPPSADELSERQDRRQVQRGLTSHKTIMVANLKGGAGKTTFTYFLATLLGRVRGGTVLAWDNNENRGTLAKRSPVEPNTDATAIDLLHELQFFQGSGQVAELVNFVRPQGSNKFDLLASQNQGASRPVIDGDGFLQLHELLQTFYRMIVVDTGNASTASTWQATASVADQIVIVCENAVDSSETAAETIDTLLSEGYEHVVSNSVAVVIDSAKAPNAAMRKDDKERLERIVEHLSNHVRTVHVLPWEESLHDGGAIQWERLSSKTHRTMMEAAASIVRAL